MRIYILVLVIVTAALGFEYWNLSKHPEASFFMQAQKSGWISPTAKINTKPGDFVGFWLGWAGISVMLLMNVYSIRKRAGFLSGAGSLKAYMDFHIFCGLLGPVFILFHCNLKARGVVAISFWSMIISFSSGVIGRYFYLQLVRQKTDFEKNSADWLRRLRRVLEKAKLTAAEDQIQGAVKGALAMAGATRDMSNPITTLVASLLADIKLAVSDPVTPQGWPTSTKYCLKEFAVNTRRARTLEPFQKLMGYWHAFHFPFAIFMYIAAAIHIISSLIFLKAS